MFFVSVSYMFKDLNSTQYWFQNKKNKFYIESHYDLLSTVQESIIKIKNSTSLKISAVFCYENW